MFGSEINRHMTHFPRIRVLMKVSVFLVPTCYYIAFLLLVHSYSLSALGFALAGGFVSLAFPPFLIERTDPRMDDRAVFGPLWLRFLGLLGYLLVYFWLSDLETPEISALWARLRKTHALIDTRLIGGFALIWISVIVSGLRRHHLTSDLAIFQYYGNSNSVNKDELP